MKDDFYLTDLREQETILKIDYYSRIISIYTCRKNVAKRLERKLGEPTQKYYTNSLLSAVKYEIPFENKKEISGILSRPVLIGNMI